MSTFLLPIFKSYSLLKILNNTTLHRIYGTHIKDKVLPFTKDTLLGRMLFYVSNEEDIKRKNLLQHNGPDIINNLLHGKTNNLRNLNDDQIANLIYNINDNILSRNKQNLQKVLLLLDVECCFRLNMLMPETSFKLLNAFMNVVPNRITELKFYQHVTDNIDKCLNNISKQELLQFIFYVGLQKKTKKAQTLLRKCLKIIVKELLDKLTVEDLCIICNATYKANVKLSVDFLTKLKQVLNENLNLMKDPAFFITFLKTLKQNHFADEDLLSTISCTIFFNKTSQYYNFSTLSYILSLYADCLYYDEQLLDFLIDKSIGQLRDLHEVTTKKMHFSKQLRAKDITILLWAMSALNYTKIEPNILNNLFVSKIKERIKVREYQTSPDVLTDALLFMWMLNCRPIEILSDALTLENARLIKEKNAKSKHRLNLLLTCIQLEEPEIYEKLLIRPTGITNFNSSVQLQNRPLLQKVFKNLQSLAPISKLESIKTCCQIPYLNIVGISGSNGARNKILNIEVLDDHTCVKNRSNHPSGFMQLKLRILEKTEVPLIVINSDEIDSMDDQELCDYIKEQIDLVLY